MLDGWIERTGTGKEVHRVRRRPDSVLRHCLSRDPRSFWGSGGY